MATKLKKVKSWSELFKAAEADDRWKRIVIGALQNLGCEHLACPHDIGRTPKWRRFYHGLQEYISALVGEYGESETKAEKQVLAEVNNVIDCCDDVELRDMATWYLAVALTYWGRGRSEHDAVENCRKAGASRWQLTIVWRIEWEVQGPPAKIDPKADAPWVDDAGLLRYRADAECTKIARYSNGRRTAVKEETDGSKGD